MKKIILLLLMLLSFSGYSQNKTKHEPAAPRSEVFSTTVDEYNYMTKGYKVQVESGLDMKKGYTINDLNTLDDGNYSFQYKALIRSNKSLAGIIIIAYSKVYDNKYYLAIPVNNADLYAFHFKQLEQWDKPMLLAYTKFTSALLGGYLYDLQEASINQN